MLKLRLWLRLRSNERKLRRAALAAKLTKAEVDALVAKYAVLPKTVTFNVAPPSSVDGQRIIAALEQHFRRGGKMDLGKGNGPDPIGV